MKYKITAKEMPIKDLFTDDELSTLYELAQRGLGRELEEETDYHEGKGYYHDNFEKMQFLMERLHTLCDTFHTSLAVESLSIDARPDRKGR